MKELIQYNWEVRDEYIKAFGRLPLEEIQKDRKAGLGTILKTFLHIIDVEYSWKRAMNNKPDVAINFEEYEDLESISELSNQLRNEISEYLNLWTIESEEDTISPSWLSETYSKGEIIRHIIVHEVHHIGQLSIWARELGITPVNTNFIGRGIIKNMKNM